MAAAVTLTTLVGVSVFADSRPGKETRSGQSGSRVEVRGSRGDSNRSSGGRIQREPARSTANRNNGGRSTDNGAWRDDSRQRSTAPSQSRAQVDRNRSDDRRNDDSRRETVRRSDDDRRSDARRETVRRDDNRRNDNHRDSVRRDSVRSNDNTRYRDSRYGRTSRYDNRPRFNYSGRVHRVNPYNGGYRVWLTGCNYPFFIPAAHYHRDRFRVGLSISLGGFYNSLGYYDYYDDRYDSRYYDVRTSRGEMEGVVESVDYRRETFVVRNRATGSYVTVVHLDRGRDPVRSGDYVELRGDWTRDGVFEAYGIDILR